MTITTKKKLIAAIVEYSNAESRLATVDDPDKMKGPIEQVQKTWEALEKTIDSIEVSTVSEIYDHNAEIPGSPSILDVFVKAWDKVYLVRRNKPLAFIFNGVKVTLSW